MKSINIPVPVLGDEAVALGAMDAGASVAYGYPGTPSTEIMEYLQRHGDDDLIARWCSNEKTATEGAVGVSYGGKRSLVTMKHVGLNVAMDAFVNSCLMKIHGGLVFAVADDPGMHSSQNEQDTRYLADFAGTVCLEPRNHQEVYEMTREAFELSEQFHIPVVVRLVTRLSHSRGSIERSPAKKKGDLGKVDDRYGWMTLPALARRSWKTLLDQQPEFLTWSEASPYNTLFLNTGFTDFTVITSGLGGNYYQENEEELTTALGQRPGHLHVGTYPIPAGLIRKAAENVDRLILIEEGYPFIERQLTTILGAPRKIQGKLDRSVPPTGELNPDVVRPVLGLPPRESRASLQVDTGTFTLPGRPPQLCPGCPHTDTFRAINDARGDKATSIVTSDIGCYALGALPPLNAVETILCMGASIGMARGAAEAGHRNVVATIGDSTFFHSGIPALIDAVASGANMTVVIMDNSTTGMTGGQDTILPGSRIRDLVVACGVDPDHVVEMNPIPKMHEENSEIVKRELAYEGLSVIIPVRECVQTKLQKARAKKAAVA